VFVEKPLTLSARQGRDVLHALERRFVVNQVGYVLRFNDVIRQVKKHLDNNVLGELLNFKVEMYGPTVLQGAKSSWRSKKHEGGGCLYEFGSHSVDMVNYLIGVPDEITGTAFQNIYSDGVEDAVTSTFLYKSGVRGNLMVNWSDASCRKPTYRFEVVGRNGKIIADLHGYKIFLREEIGADGFTEGWNQRYVTDCFEPVGFYLRGYEFTRQVEHFVACMEKGEPSEVCSFEQGHQADIVIERLRQDAESRQF
jgi:predicted dehydrogenase